MSHSLALPRRVTDLGIHTLRMRDEIMYCNIILLRRVKSVNVIPRDNIRYITGRGTIV